MPEFFTLPRDDQREALLAAAARSGRPPHLLEKDVWVVWALQTPWILDLDATVKCLYGKQEGRLWATTRRSWGDRRTVIIAR